jgi:hypothetical protein
MAPLDNKTLADLKLAQARFQQQVFASDSTWNHLLQMYQICTRVLPHRKELQSFAQRHEKSPIRFCERLMGRDWFEPPKQMSARQAQTVLEAAPLSTKLLTAPHDMQEADARMLLKVMRTLAARPPGRKRLEIYAKALELRNAGRPFHQICKQLVPSYAIISSAERRAKREQMRSGVARLVRALGQNKG